MIAKFFSGIIAYIRALSFVSKPGYGKYFIYSGLLGLVIFSGSIYLIKGISPTVTSWMTSVIPWDFGWLDTITGWVSYIFSGTLFLFVFKYLMLILTAPIMSALSEKVEKDITGVDQHRSVIINIVPDLIRGLRVNLRNITREFFLLALLFFLSFIPVIGIATTILGLIIQGYYAGWGNADFWAERHFSYRDTVRYMKREKGMLTSNGLIYVLLISIPIVGVFIGPPLATIAITTEAIKVFDQDFI